MKLWIVPLTNWWHSIVICYEKFGELRETLKTREYYLIVVILLKRMGNAIFKVKTFLAMGNQLNAAKYEVNIS